MAGKELLVAFVLCGLLILQSTSGYLIFTEEPDSLTALYTEKLTFDCAATNATLYEWLIDETQNYLFDSDIDTTSVTSVENGGVKVSTLTIHPPQAADKLNHTFVQCVAISHILGSSTAEYNKSKKALLQVQGKLDAPEINQVLIDCSSRTVHISWDEPPTLAEIPVTGYEVCDEYCTPVRNTSWTGNISIAKASSCEIYTTEIAALTDSEEEKGNYAMVNNTFTQEPKVLAEEQIASKVVFLAQDESFQIDFSIYFNETDVCHLPSAYNVTVYYLNANLRETFFIPHLEFAPEDDTCMFKQNFSVHVSGKLTDVFSELEPQNCMGSNKSITVKNRLFRLQSVYLNNNYVTCNFAEGSDALGCETVLTCNTSVSGKIPSSEMTSKITLEPSFSYTTGKFATNEISDCLTYDVSVYEVLPNGSMGADVVQVFSNVTFEPGSLLPTSSNEWLPTPSSSVIHVTPTEVSKDTGRLTTTIATSTVLVSVIVAAIVAIGVGCLCYKVCKRHKRTKVLKINPYNQHEEKETLF